MIELPSDEKGLLKAAQDLIEICRVSAPSRAAMCRAIHVFVESGCDSGGTESLINMMPNHLKRLGSHLYSPVELRFNIDFEHEYPKEYYDRSNVVAKAVTRVWDRNDTDLLFGQGVDEALKYGAVFMKQMAKEEGPDHALVMDRRLVMPWQFGVYREDVSDLSKQSAMCETTMLTLPEVWQRIYHLPNADKLYERIKAKSSKGQEGDEINSFFLPILSSSPLDTSGNVGASRPGGIVNLFNGQVGPAGVQIAADMVKMHELWVQGETDYVTLQLIEPDLLITKYKKSNLLIPGDTSSMLHPYTIIQPNPVVGSIWGVSEIRNLIKTQCWLSTTLEDVKRLLGVQFDKIMGFEGVDGLTDEMYDQQRLAGYISVPQGGKMTDLTPHFPAEAMPLVKFQMESINMQGGFPPVLQGQGESGVRSQAHAGTLVKTASPRQRDQSLIVERQCAKAGDLTLSIMEAKEARKYWTNGETIETMEKTSFLLGDLPDDRRVIVDSHSSSPIFMDDHTQLTIGGLKLGIVDGESAIDDLPFANKELKKKRLKAKQEAAKAQMEKLLKDYPEVGEKLAVKQLMGGKR